MKFFQGWNWHQCEISVWRRAVRVKGLKRLPSFPTLAMLHLQQSHGEEAMRKESGEPRYRLPSDGWNRWFSWPASTIQWDCEFTEGRSKLHSHKSRRGRSRKKNWAGYKMINNIGVWKQNFRPVVDSVNDKKQKLHRNKRVKGCRALSTSWTLRMERGQCLWRDSDPLCVQINDGSHSNARAGKRSVPCQNNLNLWMKRIWIMK